MNIIENINERLSFDMEDVGYGGEQEVQQVLDTSPIKLPGDYIEFLKSISGAQANGVEFLVKDEGTLSIWIWDAKMALQQYEDYKSSYPMYAPIIDKIWVVGSDVGDLVFFYAEGKDGFGLYRAEGGSLGFAADKIADTLTDLLVHGVGIDVAMLLSHWKIEDEISKP